MNDTENYFRALSDMFESDGWKLYQQEIDALVTAQAQACEVADGNDVYRAQGATLLARRMALWSHGQMNAYDQWLAERAEGDQS